MSRAELYSNESCLPVGKELPFKPFSRNFYALIAQCESYTGNSATFINPHVAIIPVDKDVRLVVTL